MKTLLKMLLGLTAILFSKESFAQGNWNVRGNTADSSYFLGTINNEILRVKTDSVDRIIVGTNDSIQFKGTALFDSVVIPNGYLQVDSIRVRVIHVGDSSIVIGGTQTGTTNNIITSNLGIPTLNIAPNNGLTVFRNSSGPANADNARVGIGLLTPIITNCSCGETPGLM